MSDIFISYSSADRDRAALLAHALQARGWSVWWDRTIPPGRQFDEVIEEALDAARCVVVLWSKASIASSWVKNEASEAMRRKALIPALIDDQVRIPLEFRRLQAADLSRWHGETTMPEFEQFCAAIAGELGARPPGPAPAPAPAPLRPAPAPSSGGGTAATPRSRKPLFIGIGVGVFVLVVLAAVLGDQSQNMPAPGPAPYTPPGNLAVTRADPGIHANLVWRDYVLAYSGNVSWDGTSNWALITASVSDGYTHQSLGNRQLRASVVPNGPRQIMLSTSVPVAGDSRTPGPHSHNVNLIFQAQADGRWMFVQNCMSPTDCY
jgi:hypothetical protein